MEVVTIKERDRMMEAVISGLMANPKVVQCARDLIMDDQIQIKNIVYVAQEVCRVVERGVEMVDHKVVERGSQTNGG